MKDKMAALPSGVQDICRKLKAQLEELEVTLEQSLPIEEKERRTKLLLELKRQLAELS